MILGTVPRLEKQLPLSISRQSKWEAMTYKTQILETYDNQNRFVNNLFVRSYLHDLGVSYRVELDVGKRPAEKLWAKLIKEDKKDLLSIWSKNSLLRIKFLIDASMLPRNYFEIVQ
jgi:hypothetical protein